MKRLLIILPLLFWMSCGEDAEDNLTAELVGTWYLTDGELYMEMTTNSDQTMIDQFGPGIGSIEVEGTVNTSLTYMILSLGKVTLTYRPFTGSKLRQYFSPCPVFCTSL